MKEKKVYSKENKKVELPLNITKLPKHIPQSVRDTLLLLSIAVKPHELVLGGSLAKNTHLKDNHDCDVFVRFNPNEEELQPKSLKKNTVEKAKTLSDKLEELLKKTPYEFTRLHGSRDYFQAHINEYQYEIVPVLNITNPKDAQNVTDMSPLHVAWVVERLTKKLREDIKKAKLFCKTARVYGAESYIGGFSGHIIDILIIHYDGFDNFCKAVQFWNPTKKQIIIDPMHFYKSKNHILEVLNESKQNSPLIIIDPLQPNRNAASALTIQKLVQFQKLVSNYLDAIKKKKDTKALKAFFTPKPLSFDTFKKEAKLQFSKKRGAEKDLAFFTLRAQPISEKIDIAGAQMKKVSEFIQIQGQAEGFKVYVDFELKVKTIFVATPTPKISQYTIIKGPPLTMKTAVSAFCKDKDLTFEKIIRSKKSKAKNVIRHKQQIPDVTPYIFAKVPRKYTTFESFLYALKERTYVRDKVREISLHLAK
jgi:tRNA CCA-adding enzyme